MFALFTVDGLDQICGTVTDMRREARDLSRTGFDVWFYELADDFDVESWVDENPDKRPGGANVKGSGKVRAAD